MNDLLYCKDLYKPIKVKDKPSTMDDKEWEVQHRKVIAYIRRWMDINLHEHISDETCLAKVRKSLCEKDSEKQNFSPRKACKFKV